MRNFNEQPEKLQLIEKKYFFENSACPDQYGYYLYNENSSRTGSAYVLYEKVSPMKTLSNSVKMTHTGADYVKVRTKPHNLSILRDRDLVCMEKLFIFVSSTICHH